MSDMFSLFSLSCFAINSKLTSVHVQENLIINSNINLCSRKHTSDTSFTNLTGERNTHKLAREGKGEGNIL